MTQHDLDRKFMKEEIAWAHDCVAMEWKAASDLAASLCDVDEAGRAKVDPTAIAIKLHQTEINAPHHYTWGVVTCDQCKVEFGKLLRIASECSRDVSHLCGSQELDTASSSRPEIEAHDFLGCILQEPHRGSLVPDFKFLGAGRT
jgi:hypothetical protein